MNSFVNFEILRESAFTLFTKRKMISRVCSPDRIELVYVPHYLFKVTLNQKNDLTELVTVDAIHGLFAYYQNLAMKTKPSKEAMIIPFIMNLKTASQKGLATYEKILFQMNLKTSKHQKICSFKFQESFYYPYWVGYFKEKERISFNVLDAVDGKIQGPKINSLILKGLIIVDSQSRKFF